MSIQALHLTGPALRFFETSGSLQPARQGNAVVRPHARLTAMVDDRPSTEKAAAPPRRLRDTQLVVRLAVCMIAFVAFAAGGVFALFSGWVPQHREWQVLLACVLGGFACLGFLFAPLLLGIRCKGCGRRIFRAAASQTRSPTCRKIADGNSS